MDNFGFSSSAAGTYVVGQGGSQAIRWTPSGGILNLGFLPGGAFSAAQDTSFDGSVVIGVGNYVPESPFTPLEAFRWTQSEGMVGLGFLDALPSGARESFANATSSDGSVVVGTSTTSSTGEAFRWTLSGGMRGLGLLPGYPKSQAEAVSGDGSIVAGYAYTTDDSSIQAVRWGLAGMTALGSLPGMTHTGALGISEDGNVVVGFNRSGSIQKEGFRWTESDGMIGLGLLPGGTYSAGMAASRDGGVIVGYGENNRRETEAAIWDTVHGLRNLKTVLQTDYGLDVAARLGVARSISPDGTVIVGDGPDGAWIATIPEPPVGVSGVIGLALLLRRAKRRR